MNADWASIIVAFLMALGTFLGVVLTNRKTQALTEYKIQELPEEVHKHNNIIERTYQLEKRADLTDAELRRINHQLDNLEKEGDSK